MRDKIAVAEVRIEQVIEEKKKLEGTLLELAVLSENQKTKLEDAEKERKKYLEKLARDINSLRKQPIPKDCQGAVDFAIKNKDDLKW